MTDLRPTDPGVQLRDDGHVSSDLFEQLKEQRLSPEAVIYLLAEHLGDLCPECAGEIVSRYAGSQAGPGLEERSAGGGAASSPATAQVLARLRGLPRSDRAEAVKADPEARGPAVVAALIRQAQDHVATDPAAAYLWAELAALAARLSHLEETDLGALASAHQAHALRAMGDVQGAEARFKPALERLGSRPAPDPMIASEIGLLYGSMLIDLRRLSDALEVLDRAFVDAKSVEDSTRAAQALGQMAVVYDHLERPTLAVYFAKRALSHLHPVDPDDPDPLALEISFRLVHYLLAAGQLFEAWERYFEELPSFPDSWQPRLLWFEGALAAAQGDAEAAETAFVSVRRHYRKTGDALHVAAASLDLADLYLQVGRESDIPETASYALEALAASSDPSPAHLVAALRQLQRAALERRLDPAALHKLRRHVKDLRTRPPVAPAKPS